MSDVNPILSKLRIATTKLQASLFFLCIDQGSVSKLLRGKDLVDRLWQLLKSKRECARVLLYAFTESKKPNTVVDNQLKQFVSQVRHPATILGAYAWSRLSNVAQERLLTFWHDNAFLVTDK